MVVRAETISANDSDNGSQDGDYSAADNSDASNVNLESDKNHGEDGKDSGKDDSGKDGDDADKDNDDAQYAKDSYRSNVLAILTADLDNPLDGNSSDNNHMLKPTHQDNEYVQN